MFAGVAGAQVVNFDIPAESAAASIPEFARQAGVQIVAPGNLGGTATPAVKGRLPARVALEQLLSGTDLVVAVDDGPVIALRLAGAPNAATEAINGQCKCIGQLNSSGRDDMNSKDNCMKRLLITGGSSLLMACGAVGSAWAQLATTTTAGPAASGNSDALEEVVVTAERRAEDLQKVAASIDVRQGADLADQGRVSTTQILEDVPDVTVGFLQPGQAADNPNGNISIRGVESTQQTGGRPGPSATATYVDDVYQGIGLDYDLNRVEVLRGPQGTLYGRSATGGVVAFHTNDPVLGQFSTELFAQYGSDDLRNGTAVVNLPIGDDLAIRVAGHEDDQHGYFWNVEGDRFSIEEGRIKILYEPLANLRILLSASSELIDTWAGGPAQNLNASGAINFDAGSTAINPIAGNQYAQYFANVNYDFGVANLTYVGSMHTYHQSGFEGIVGPPFMPINTEGGSSPDQFNNQELRLASDPGGPLTWIVGANFYSNIYTATQASIVQYASECGPCGKVDPTPGVDGGEIFSNGFNGSLKDYGLFTEETYAIQDNLRVTGGLRYDRTDQRQLTFYNFNVNYDAFGQNVGTCANLESVSGAPLPCVYSAQDAVANFHNFTYKARVEYDLTPQNMLYAMVSTGFLPGDAQLSPQPQANGSVNFVPLNFSQERLTSYELGSKNRFLADQLQVNGSAFYYDYQGYQEAAQTGQLPSGAPIFVIVAVPVRMIGVDFDATWLLTPVDRILLNGNVLNAEITSFPTLPGTMTSEQTDIAIKRLPGVPESTVTLAYSHTFSFPNGSRLVPRAEGRYTGAENLIELTQVQLPKYSVDDYQTDHSFVELSAEWISPKGTYSLGAYGRNLGNTIYKQFISINNGNVQVYPSEPRNFGVYFHAKF
jgi:iron complex outermembrane receptor protein